MNPTATVAAADHGITKAYLQLIRLPNVFTAMADILLGFLFTHETLHEWPVLGLLLLSSSCLYMAGMVLNDLFDFEVDWHERPHRPLPSGRIHPSTARWLGIGLLLLGVGAAWSINALIPIWRPGITATALAALIVVYDAALRRTPLSPLVMGGCRALNVLLGMSAASFGWHPVHLVIAMGIGVYIYGVTWFARNEAEISHPLRLSLATLLMLVGMAVLASYPHFIDFGLPEVSRPAEDVIPRFRTLMLILGGLLAWRCLGAILHPAPQRVQMVVKSSIISLIVLDAAVCFTVHGFYGAILILALLIPTLVSGRWIYST